VAQHRAPKLLTTVEQRIALMKNAGIQQVLVVPFNRPFSELGPEEFVRAALHDGMHARLVLVGDNFRFGHRQAGDADGLRTLGQRYGFDVEIVPRVRVRGRVVSSTAVRNLIETGGVSLAGRLLLRPFALEGTVVSGHGIGSKQTVPTLNLDTGAEVLPAKGVYVTRTHDLENGRVWPSITNVGTRPTFDGDRLTIETWLLAPLDGVSPTRIRVEFLTRVRDERRFESAEALKAQILRDAGRANTFHRRLARFTKSACDSPGLPASNPFPARGS
jgi:riboflavin kinase/FMN adenylyltransferase